MKNSSKIFFEKYKEYLNELNFFLRKLFLISSKEKEIKEIYKITREVLASGGKFLRSLITLFSCEIICGKYKPALPIAIAYELGHNATLIQDDFIDHSLLRRGKLTVHAKYSPAVAILVSDLLIFRIFYLVSQYANYKTVSKSQICRLLEIIGKSATDTAVGEYLDERFTGKINLPLKKYFKLIEYKTGRLFAGPLACGAIIGGASNRETALMYEIGKKIGIAFQIQDDLLDIIGKESMLKKPIFSDFKNGKPNFVILHAFKKSPYKLRKVMKELFGRKRISLKDMENLKKIFTETGSISAAKKECRKWKDEAEEMLMKGIKREYFSAKEKLIDVIEFITERNI